ncbi:RNase H family protein [Saccharopolyspora tripterygii]
MTERVIAATDGSAQPNPGPTGWAWVLGDAQGNPLRGESGFLGHATNNVGELTAVAELLASTDPAVPLDIRIDSQYAMNVVTGKNRASKNLELIAHIKQTLSDRDVTFTWVAAHQADGDLLNAHADHAAQDAVRNRQGRHWTATDLQALDIRHEPVPPDHSRAPMTKPGGCKATTKAGKPCPIDPRPSGLCHVHDPAVQCQAITSKGRRCSVATGGGRCDKHRYRLL